MARVDNTNWGNKKVSSGGITKTLADWLGADISIRTISDFGTVVADGVTDNSTAFQAAASSGQRVLIPYTPLPYYIATYPQMANRTEFIGTGSPTIKCGLRGFSASSVSDILVEGITFDYSAGASAPPVYMSSCTRIRVLRCKFISPKGNLTIINGSTDCEVEDSYFQDCSTSIILLSGVTTRRNRIRRNRIHNSVGFGIWLDDSTNQNLIEGNTTILNGLEMVGITQGCFENRIIGNHVEGCGDNGISVSGYRNTVVGNVVKGNAFRGIFLWGDHNTVTGNVCLNNGSGLASARSGIGISHGFGGSGQHNTVVGNVCYDDQASPVQEYGVRISNVAQNPVWTASQTISSSYLYRYYGLNLYKASAAGTTGATPPTHTTGTVSDGAVSWTYLRSFDTVASPSFNIISGNDATGFTASYGDGDSWTKNVLIANMQGSVIVAGLQHYADDTGAAAGGVPLLGLYRTATTVKVRMV